MVHPALAYSLAAHGNPHRAREFLAMLDISEYSVDALGSEFLDDADDDSARGLAHRVPDSCRAALRRPASLPIRGSRSTGSPATSWAVSSARSGCSPPSAATRDLARSHFASALEAHRRVRSPLLVAATLRDAGPASTTRPCSPRPNVQFAAIGLGRGVDLHRPRRPPTRIPHVIAFRRDGEVWSSAWNGHGAHVRHRRGCAISPGSLPARTPSCTSSTSSTDGPTLRSDVRVTRSTTQRAASTGARLLEIEADLADADQRADVARSERLHVERDALIDELSPPTGSVAARGGGAIPPSGRAPR